MRICLFRAFPDPFRKSMEIYASQLLRHVRPLLPDTEMIMDYLPPNVRLQPGWARLWDQYIRYQRLCKAPLADVNHVVDYGFGHLLYSLQPEKSVVTFHDAIVFKLPDVSRRTRFAVRYSLRAVRRAARVITDSENSKRDFLELVDYPADRVRVVHLGIDPAFRPLTDTDAIRKRYKLPDHFILHVGHTLPYMNIEGTLRALEHLDVPLVKIGGDFSSEQNTLIDQLRLRSRIQHLGRISLADLPAVYNSASALLYIPLYAGFGLPPLEAMACGTPVICSNRGSLPEIVGDAAIVVNPDDAKSAADAVSKLIADTKLRESYRERGLLNTQRFSWEKTARETLAIYREVARATA